MKRHKREKKKNRKADEDRIKIKDRQRETDVASGEFPGGERRKVVQAQNESNISMA